MTRVLVTGASGFVGRHCISPLLDAGVEVVSIGRTPLPNDLIDHVTCDIHNDQQRRQALKSIGASHLLHLAWNLEPGAYTESASNIDWLASSLRLVRDFADCGGQRVVAAGSCFEYEWSESVLSEGAPIGPSTLYSSTKDLLRRALDAYSDRAGPDAVWARLFFLYGPGENDRRLAGAVASSLLANKPVETSEGTQRRDYMYVSDAGRALAQVTLSDIRGAINVARGVAVPVRDLIEAIAACVGRPDLVDYGARPTPPNEPPVVEADIDRLTQEVGFSEFTDLADGVEATVEWWRARMAPSI